MNNIETVLISTIYAIEPIMVCVNEYSLSKIILLREENAPKEKLLTEETLKSSIGQLIPIETKITELYDVVQVAKDTADIIDEESNKNNIIVNISGGRKPQALGALFGSYARHQLVDSIVYIKQEGNIPLELPVMSFKLSSTKIKLLKSLEDGISTVNELATILNISRGMTYNHLRELRDMGCIDKKTLTITTAGLLAII